MKRTLRDAVSGSYRVVREIGRGRMGAVYLAERDDEQYQKLVAIKVIKRGMDTDYVLNRFRLERQILAGLEHPNIARLIDGGVTEEGLPFFAMEYVDGELITDYVARHNLSIAGRLAFDAQIYLGDGLMIKRDTAKAAMTYRKARELADIALKATPTSLQSRRNLEIADLRLARVGN